MAHLQGPEGYLERKPISWCGRDSGNVGIGLSNWCGRLCKSHDYKAVCEGNNLSGSYIFGNYAGTMSLLNAPSLPPASLDLVFFFCFVVVFCFLAS